MRTEQAVIVEILGSFIVVTDDYGDNVTVRKDYVTGIPRVGATVTLVHAHDRTRAFVEPEEKPMRLASDPDESGVQLIGRFFAQEEKLRSVG